jgi:radical SAM superfamily enzyme YgiQ (UPF0313 family)
MDKILLIQPPIRDFYLTAKRTIPYGLMCIAAALRREGFAVEIFDALATGRSRIIDWPPEMAYLAPYYGRPDRSPFGLFHHYRHFGYSFEHIGRTAKNSGAFLVGVSSLFTPYAEEALAVARAVKRFHPDCAVVVGGHHPTSLPAAVMAESAVDCVIRGEGEAALPLLAKALRGGSDLGGVPGIVYRKADGRLRTASPALMQDLEGYPQPALDLMKHAFYRRRGRGSAVLTASRGCPLKCSYCCLASSPATYRRRRVASVVAEIDAWVGDWSAGFIDFEDENLTLDREWARRFFTEMRRRFQGANLELRAMNGLYPPSLDEEMIHLMRSAGFRALNLSLGTTDPAQLRRFNRPDVRDSLERSLVAAERLGLGAVSYLIVGAPGQMPETSVADLIYLAERRTLAGVSVFYPAPGSADYERCEKEGLLPSQFSLMRGSGLPISHTTDRTQTATLLRMGRILNFIKGLDAEGIDLPTPDPAVRSRLGETDRRVVGVRLLGWFLKDGKIRGLKPDGRVYEHVIDRDLSRRFLQGLEAAGVSRRKAISIRSNG